MRAATWGNLYWPVFLIAVSALFLAPEVYALATNAANTLSDYAWRELRIPLTSSRPVIHNAVWLLTQGAYLVMVFWLWRHIWYAEYR